MPIVPLSNLFTPTDFRTPFIDVKTGILTEYWQKKFSRLFAGQIGSVAMHTITLAKLTPGGTTGSITWNSDGVVTAFVDPT